MFSFLYVIESTDDAQSFLGYVFSTKLLCHILYSHQHHLHICHRRNLMNRRQL